MTAERPIRGEAHKRPHPAPVEPHHGHAPGCAADGHRDSLQRREPAAAPLPPGIFPRGSPEIQEFIQTAPVPFHCVDSRGLILWANPAELDLFGYAPGEFIGRNLSEFIPDAAAADEVARMLADHDDFRAYETCIRCRDGSTRDVSIDSTWLREAETCLYARCFVRDISRHKRLQERLSRQSLEAQLIHRATTLAAETDSFEDALKGCVEIVCEMTGWPIGHVFLPDHQRQELISTGIWHFEDPNAFVTLREVTENTRFTRRVGLPGKIWRDGEPVWIVNVAQSEIFSRRPLCSELGVKGAFGFPVKVRNETVAIFEFFAKEEMAPDHNLLLMVRSVGEQMGRVLERRRAQDEQARLAAIVDTSYDAIISKSLDGTIMSWNLGAQHLFGFTPEEAIGQSIALITPPERMHESLQLLETIKSGKRLEQFETVRVCKDGRLINVSLTASPITDAVGRVIGASAIERDVTARLRAQEELQQAKDAAEAANRLKSEFLANISHELRTPMNAIIGMTDLALSEDLQPHVRDYLQTSRESASTLLALLNDILDLSRIESGKLFLEAKLFDVRRAVESIVAEFQRPAREKGLELSFHIDDSVPQELCGDPLRLGQILSNLVGNAVKFTRTGSVRLHAEVESARDRGVHLHFVVIDTGIGLSPKDQQRIFAPFTQADSSTTRHFGGAGLGLAICRKLTQMMNGRLWVESQLGKGSRFHFTARFEIPRPRGASPSRATAPEHRSTCAAATPTEEPDGLHLGKAAQRTAHPLRVLLAEDTPANQKVVKAILEKRGHLVQIAANGRDAVEQLHANEFDVVLMDVQMPEMDGFQATRLIRNSPDPRVARIPILAMTAHAMHGDRELCLDSGMDIYISKPVDAELMIEMIERMTAANSRESQNSQPPPAAPSPPAADDVCNIDEALARLGGSEELLRDIIGFFREDAPQLLATIRDALNSHDPQEVARAAHSLRGLAANFSAKPAIDAAFKLEHAAEARDLAAASALAGRLEEETNRLLSALKAIRPQA